MRNLKTAVIVISTLIASTPAFAAEIYTKATFTGGIFGGNANAQAPFNLAGITQGMPLSGTFVYANSLIPAGGSGYVNVLPSQFPDVANIPEADQFKFTLGSLVFTPTGADLYAIQYLNGQFNGFAYSDDFAYQGGSYRLSIQGTLFSINEVLNGNPGNLKVSGYINGGNGSLTDQTTYTPTPPTNGAVPEPATWAMMIIGFGAIGSAARRRRHNVNVSFG